MAILRKPRFGIPHRRGRIAIDGTEVALPIDQRIAHGKRLRHADQRVVNRRVAVRMKFAQHFADNLGALAGGPVGREAHFVHAEKNAAMNRLQTVANIRQRAAHDHAHRVIEVRPLHLVFDIDGDVPARPAREERILRRRRWALRWISLICHNYSGKSYFSIELRTKWFFGSKVPLV